MVCISRPVTISLFRSSRPDHEQALAGCEPFCAFEAAFGKAWCGRANRVRKAFAAVCADGSLSHGIKGFAAVCAFWKILTLSPIFQVLLQFQGLILLFRVFSPHWRLSAVARRFWALAAALLVLWAAVHPVLLNALAGERVLLCTARGMEWVAVAQAAQEGQEAQEGQGVQKAPEWAGSSSSGPLKQAAPLICPWCTFMQLLGAAPAATAALAAFSRAHLVRVLAAFVCPLWVEAARHLRALPGRGPPPGARFPVF